MQGLSRRRVLRLSGASLAAATAGCLDQSESDDPTPNAGNRDGNGNGNGNDTEDDPLIDPIDDPLEATYPDNVAQFRDSLENWGYRPQETIPDAVEQAWRLPEVNTGDHSAAKASATPTSDGGLVMPGDTGIVTALTADGEVLWEADTETDGNGIHGTAVVTADTVFIGAYDGVLYAFDLETGDEVWAEKLGGSIGSSPVFDGDRVFVAVEYPDPEGSMFAVDPDTGEVLWEDAESRPTDHPHSTPAIDPNAGRLVVGANDGVLYGWQYPDLELEWTFETDPDNDTDGEIKGPIATYDGGAYFGSWDQRIYRVDLEDGTEDWSVETGGLSMTGPGIDPSLGVVFAGSHDGNLYALDAATGEEHWRFGTDSALTGCPTVCADRVVFGSKDRTLYAVEKQTGEEVWHVDHDGVVTSTPLVVDGAIYYAERAPAPEDGETDGGAYKLVEA
ncbi:PQQ-binding-like beta-propeller repeat protein [Saliphagus sp. GCM10025308]